MNGFRTSSLNQSPVPLGEASIDDDSLEAGLIESGTYYRTFKSFKRSRILT